MKLLNIEIYRVDHLDFNRFPVRKFETSNTLYYNKYISLCAAVQKYVYPNLRALFGRRSSGSWSYNTPSPLRGMNISLVHAYSTAVPMSEWKHHTHIIRPHSTYVLGMLCDRQNLAMKNIEIVSPKYSITIDVSTVCARLKWFHVWANLLTGTHSAHAYTIQKT